MPAGMFTAAIGSQGLFNTGTQDCTNKFVVSEILYGSAEIHPVADLDRADHVLLIGTNPQISKMSFLSTPDPVDALLEARRRGASIPFVNPVALDDLSDVGETLQVRPDTDAYLLAAMLCEIDRSSDLELDAKAAASLLNLDKRSAFVAAYSQERVTSVVGLEAERLCGMARDFARAPPAAVHLSTGTNMGRQGALAYYLAQMPSLLTGNLGRAGGNLLPARGLAPMQMPQELSAEQATAWGSYRPARGTPPGC